MCMEIVPLNSLPKICHNTSVTEHKSGPKLLRCEGCLAVRYCGKEHQEEDWPNHKELCQLLKELNKQNVNNVSLQDKIIKHLKNEICAGQAFTASRIILASARSFHDAESLTRLFEEVFRPLYPKNHRMLQSMNSALDNLGVRFLFQIMTYSDSTKGPMIQVYPDLEELNEEEFEDFLLSFYDDETIEPLLFYAKSQLTKKNDYVNRALDVFNRLSSKKGSSDYFHGCCSLAEYFNSVGESDKCKQYCLFGLSFFEENEEARPYISKEKTRLSELLNKHHS